MLGYMTPERTHTCGLCGAFTTILGSAGETWNSYQAPAMAAWETQHCRQVQPRSRGWRCDGDVPEPDW